MTRKAPKSEYDAVLAPRHDPAGGNDLDHVQELFENASAPYLASAWPWLGWAVLLPAAALATDGMARARGGFAVVLLWSVTILLGGAIEWLAGRRGRRDLIDSVLAGWAFRLQGNLSLIAVALSLAVAAAGHFSLLPGLWLLLLGHSLFALGGLAYKPLRRSGIIYQVGGALALLFQHASLPIFALTTALGNGLLALAIRRSPPARSASR